MFSSKGDHQSPPSSSSSSTVFLCSSCSFRRFLRGRALPWSRYIAPQVCPWTNRCYEMLVSGRVLNLETYFFQFFLAKKKLWFLSILYLVGGFNPFEKNMSQIGSFPQVGVQIKNIWNQQLDINFEDFSWLQQVTLFVTCQRTNVAPEKCVTPVPIERSWHSLHCCNRWYLPRPNNQRTPFETRNQTISLVPR